MPAISPVSASAPAVRAAERSSTLLRMISMIVAFIFEDGGSLISLRRPASQFGICRIVYVQLVPSRYERTSGELITEATCWGQLDSRAIVVWATPYVRAISDRLSPASRRASASCRWCCVSLGGRPMCTPRALPRARPSPVRARINSRSIPPTPRAPSTSIDHAA
jgi:hypothetical protein